MSLLTYQFLAALIIFLLSLSILYPIKKKHIAGHTDSIEWGEAFASGIFLGAAFLHLLPEAVHYFHEIYPLEHFPIAELVSIASFLLLLFLERISLAFSHHHYRKSVPIILALILIIHSLAEGAALGLGQTFSEMFMLFIAIIAHKASEGFAFCVVMLRHQFSFKHIALIIFLFSWMTPLGIGLGSFVQHLSIAHAGALTAALFNAFAAGTFLYISTLHHIQFHKHTDECPTIVPFFFLVLGVLIMALLALWV